MTVALTLAIPAFVTVAYARSISYTDVFTPTVSMPVAHPKRIVPRGMLGRGAELAPLRPGARIDATPLMSAAVFVAFVCLIAVGVATHELAHDEAQAWNIARTADWPWQVPFLNRYEGHPPLWPMLLWPLTRFGNPVLLQCFSATLAVATIALLLKDAPFSFRVRALIPFGAYPLYDFSVLARPYGLALLLVAVLAVTLRRGSGRLLLPALLCGALAATSAFGIVLSAPVALFTLLECVRRRRPSLGELLLACAAYLCLALAAGLAVLLPTGPSEFEHAMREGARVRPSMGALVVTLNAFPHFRTLPLGVGARLWGSPALYAALVAAGSVVFLAVGTRLRMASHALGTWILVVLCVTGLAMYTSTTEERYLGHVFLAALLLLWVCDDSSRRRDRVPVHDGASATTPGRTARRLRAGSGAVLVAALVYHAMAGIGSIAYDVVNERTPWRRAAKTIGPLLQADDAVLINDYDYPTVTLLAWLDVPAIDMTCRGCLTRFSRWEIVEYEHARTLQDVWCGLESDGQATLVLTKRAWFLTVPGVELLGEWAPGQRDSRPHSAKLLRLVDPGVLCGADSEEMPDDPQGSAGVD